MDTIKLNATEDTPEIILDKVNGKFLIRGKSLPEDATEFYEPILDWFDDYVSDPLEETTIELFLHYVNSSSVKKIFAILCLMEEIEPYHNKVMIKWSFNKGDQLMKEKGEEFRDYLEIPFELIEV